MNEIGRWLEFEKDEYWSFILATALDSIPGTIAFIGFGASIQTFDGAPPKLNPVTFSFFSHHFYCEHCII